MTATVVFRGQRLDGPALEERARRAAQGLVARGLAEGETIALMLRNEPQYLELMLAAQIAGLYFCHLNWHLTAPEVEHILRDSGARLLFAHADLLRGVAAGLPADLVVMPVDRPGDPAAADGYAAWRDGFAPYGGPARMPGVSMGYTSGTTGRPKGVRRLPAPPAQREAQAAAVQRLVEATFGVRPGVRACLAAPLYHSAPGVFAREALRQGELLVLGERFEPAALLQAIEAHRIDNLYLVPTMFSRLLGLSEDVRRGFDPSSLRFVACTGAPCPPALKQAMLDWWGPVIYETYAATETGMVTVADPALARRKPGTAGRPAGAAELRILDADGRRCAPGEVGLIHVRQPTYGEFTYHRNREARAAIERDGFVTLGDMGWLDEDGDLFVCDRASDLVISGGVNLYPVEVEQALMTLPAVADCAVFGIPDDDLGEVLMALIEPRPDQALTADDVLAHLATRLARFKLPRRIETVAALPRDDNGKVAKRRLREPYWAGRDRRV